MTRSRLAAPLRLLCAALLLGLSACKPSAPATDTTPGEAPAADAVEKAAAIADAVNPIDSPRDEVIAAMRKFMGLRSYHAEMHFSGGPRGEMTNKVDFVAPDRFRMEMAGLGTQYVIGDTMYMTMQGRSMQVPMPEGTVTQWRDPGNFREAETGMTAEALGSEDVDGVAARKYVAHHTTPRPADVTLWIGPDDLPLKMQVEGESEGRPVTTTVRYSRFNDPSIRIEPPK